MLIRHVIATDSAAWERLRTALWPGDPHGDEIAAFFAGTVPEPRAALVAEPCANVLAAIAELSIRHDIPGTAGAATGYIEGLYIAPKHRHGRLVSQLLHAARHWAQQQQCRFFASDREGRLIFDRSYRASSAGSVVPRLYR